MRDPYSVLGVRRNAGPDEIKAAWRAVAKSVHPDQNPDDPLATARFAEAGRAYEVLKDPRLRTRYDQARREAELRRMEAMKQKSAREAGEEPVDADMAEEMIERIFGAAVRPKPQETRSQEPRQQEKKPPPRSAPRPEAVRPEAFTEAADAEPAPQAAPRRASLNPFARGAAPAAELVSAIVRRIRGAQRKSVNKVPDLAIDLPVTVEDLHSRARLAVTLDDGETVKVALPAGATDGHVVRLTEQGHHVEGLRRGDVVVTLRVEKDGAFRTDGHDLRTTLPIDIQNAVLGCETAVETLDGPVVVTVPPWSNSGHVIPLPGRGLADEAGRRGTLFVELRLMLWEKPDDKMTDLMRSLREGLYL
ncbi:DnaJ C-terminal domain-containing protein [Ensifer soli]|uniref:DnaJ C-terminal domain-containing protein n=1 Tax=Ciceribacter sp. sgz301302 TaxID=3342379 RepID=UPI0035B91F00